MKEYIPHLLIIMITLPYSFSATAYEDTCNFLASLSQEEISALFKENYNSLDIPATYYDGFRNNKLSEGLFSLRDKPFISIHNKSNINDIKYIAKIEKSSKKIICRFSSKLVLNHKKSKDFCPAIEKEGKKLEYIFPEIWKNYNQPFFMKGDSYLPGVVKVDYNNDGQVEAVAKLENSRPPCANQVFIIVSDDYTKKLSYAENIGSCDKEDFITYNNETYIIKEARSTLKSKEISIIKNEYKESVCYFESQLSPEPLSDQNISRLEEVTGFYLNNYSQVLEKITITSQSTGTK